MILHLLVGVVQDIFQSEGGISRRIVWSRRYTLSSGLSPWGSFWRVASARLLVLCVRHIILLMHWLAKREALEVVTLCGAPLSCHEGAQK
jgi:hypothetical protein